MTKTLDVTCVGLQFNWKENICGRHIYVIKRIRMYLRAFCLCSGNDCEDRDNFVLDEDVKFVSWQQSRFLSH